MADALQTLTCLDQIHCLRQAEFGSSEPYLWTAFFKIEGDTVVLDLADDGRPGLFLNGACTFVATPGSHGDLRDRSVAEGDDVPIPAELGELGLSLTPIRAAERTNLPPDFSVPGTVGVVVALLEENQASDEGAAAGHLAFDHALEQGINELIPTFGIRKQDPTPEDITGLIAKVASAVEDAIAGVQGFWRNVLSFLDGDELIGAQVFTAHGDAFAACPAQPIDARFQRLLQEQAGTAIVDDYRLTGEIVAIPAGPLAYETVRRSAEYATPAAAGAPAICLVPALGVQNIVYRDTDGRLHELWRDAAGQTGTTNLTDAAAGAPTASGAPASYADTAAGQQVVVYRGDDGNVHSLYWSTGAVGHDNLTGSVGAPPAFGNPVGYFEAAAATHHVIYQTEDGSLRELYWAGADPVGHGNISWHGAPPAIGDPAAYLDTTHGANFVVYRGDDRNIHSLYWSGSGAVGHDNLSGVAATPLAAGQPAAYYTSGNDTHQVVYRSDDGDLHELWWAGSAPVSGWNMIAATPGAPPAASDPAAYYSSGLNTKHVIYRSANNHLNELRWVAGTATPAHVDLTVSALARSASDKPAAYSVESNDTRHVVVYRSTDNEIREIRWTTNSVLIFVG